MPLRNDENTKVGVMFWLGAYGDLEAQTKWGKASS